MSVVVMIWGRAETSLNKYNSDSILNIPTYSKSEQ